LSERVPVPRVDVEEGGRVKRTGPLGEGAGERSAGVGPRMEPAPCYGSRTTCQTGKEEMIVERRLLWAIVSFPLFGVAHCESPNVPTTGVDLEPPTAGIERISAALSFGEGGDSAEPGGVEGEVDGTVSEGGIRFSVPIPTTEGSGGPHPADAVRSVRVDVHARTPAGLTPGPLESFEWDLPLEQRTLDHVVLALPRTFDHIDTSLVLHLSGAMGEVQTFTHDLDAKLYRRLRYEPCADYQALREMDELVWG